MENFSLESFKKKIDAPVLPILQEADGDEYDTRLFKLMMRVFFYKAADETVLQSLFKMLSEQQELTPEEEDLRGLIQEYMGSPESRRNYEFYKLQLTCMEVLEGVILDDEILDDKSVELRVTHEEASNAQNHIDTIARDYVTKKPREGDRVQPTFRLVLQLIILSTGDDTYKNQIGEELQLCYNDRDIDGSTMDQFMDLEPLREDPAKPQNIEQAIVEKNAPEPIAGDAGSQHERARGSIEASEIRKVLEQPNRSIDQLVGDEAGKESSLLGHRSESPVQEIEPVTSPDFKSGPPRPKKPTKPLVKSTSIEEYVKPVVSLGFNPDEFFQPQAGAAEVAKQPEAPVKPAQESVPVEEHSFILSPDAATKSQPTVDEKPIEAEKSIQGDKQDAVKPAAAEPSIKEQQPEWAKQIPEPEPQKQPESKEPETKKLDAASVEPAAAKPAVEQPLPVVVEMHVEPAPVAVSDAKEEKHVTFQAEEEAVETVQHMQGTSQAEEKQPCALPVQPVVPEAKEQPVVEKEAAAEKKQEDIQQPAPEEPLKVVSPPKEEKQGSCEVAVIEAALQTTNLIETADAQVQVESPEIQKSVLNHSRLSENVTKIQQIAKDVRAEEIRLEDLSQSSKVVDATAPKSPSPMVMRQSSRSEPSLIQVSTARFLQAPVFQPELLAQEPHQQVTNLFKRLYPKAYGSPHADEGVIYRTEPCPILLIPEMPFVAGKAVGSPKEPQQPKDRSPVSQAQLQIRRKQIQIDADKKSRAQLRKETIDMLRGSRNFDETNGVARLGIFGPPQEDRYECDPKRGPAVRLRNEYRVPGMK